MPVINRQQRLVLQQKYHLLNALDRANEILDRKGMQMLQIGALLMILSYFIRGPLSLTKGLLVISLTAFVMMIVILLNIVLSPTEREFPGSTSWGEIYKDYIYTNPEECFNQMLSDLLEVTKNERSVNDKKAKYVKLSMISLILQMFSLSAAILTTLKW